MKKTVTIKTIRLENYKSFSNQLPGRKDFSCEFGHRTKIFGRNREGKSTILDAYFDLRTGKMADGSQPDKIRPHDENGVDIDRVDIVRELGLEIDGKPVTVTKKTAQKWRKPRGQSEEVFDGNVTTYSIDGFEQKQKDFQKWQENIPDPDVLLMCSNARPFLNAVQKSTAEARKILERMSGFKVEDFVSQNPEYALIDEITKGHNIEDALKQLRKNLNAQKKAAETVKTQLSYEKNRDISGNANVPELEQKIEELNQQILELDNQELELDEAIKAYDEKSAKLMDLKFKQSEIVRKANEGIVTQRKEVENVIFSLRQEKKTAENDLRMAEMDLRHANMGMDRFSSEVKKAQDDWKTWSLSEFDESKLHEIEAEQFNEESLICPTCGQAFPEEKQSEIRDSFENRKKKHIREEQKKKLDFEEERDIKLTEIAESGNKAAAELKVVKQAKEEAEQRSAEIKKTISELALQIAEKEKEFSELPEPTDVPDNAEYQRIVKEILDAEESLKQMSNGSEQRMEIRKRRSILQGEIIEKKTAIRKIESDKGEKEHLIFELEEKLKAEGQKCADIEKNIDTLLNFSIEKNKALADMVNPYIKHFQFVFYDTTIEGNIYETLRIMCSGTDFFSGLNRSDQILCEVDLVRGLQKLNNLNLPVWADNSEAVNADRLPEIEQQMIVLEVSDEPLKVETF